MQERENIVYDDYLSQIFQDIVVQLFLHKRFQALYKVGRYRSNAYDIGE